MSKNFQKFCKSLIKKEDQKQLSMKDLEHSLSECQKNFSALKSNDYIVFVETLNGSDCGGRTRLYLLAKDRAFTVDSVIDCIHGNGYTLRHNVHETFFADIKGPKSSEFSKTSKKQYAQYGFMYAELNNTLLPKEIKALEKDLNLTLQDVNLANLDWKKMLSRLNEIKQNIEKTPKKQRIYDQKEYPEFLQYLADDNFTFIGYTYFAATGKSALKEKKSDGLGILSSQRKPSFIGSVSNVFPDDIADLVKSSDLITISKIQKDSLVHRRVPLDMVLVKSFDRRGQFTGFHAFVGLFTSMTYSKTVFSIPIVREKMKSVLQKADFRKGGHNYRALTHILEKYPRDGMFQINEALISKYATEIMGLQECQRIALFCRKDILSKYISALVYVPRRVFDTRLRKVFQKILEQELGGNAQSFITNMDDSSLVRVLFTIKDFDNRQYDFNKLEKILAEAGRDWDDNLSVAIQSEKDNPTEAQTLIDRYKGAFPVSYRETHKAYQAVLDLEFAERVLDTKEIQCELYDLDGPDGSEIHLKLFHYASPAILSDILPILDRMGLRVLSEKPHELCVNDDENSKIWLHDFCLSMKPELGEHLPIKKIKDNFEKCFYQLFSDKISNDKLNSLVLSTELDYRQIIVLRAYVRYLRQIRYKHGRAILNDALTTNPKIALKMFKLFRARFDTNVKKSERDAKIKSITKKIKKMIGDIESIEYDSSLTTLLSVISNTLRTNYYQNDDWNELSLKIKTRNLIDAPSPKPWAEIFVYSHDVEGVHLRGGPVARGGIRWSDRRDDFRTEILGLMKAQVVKNGVIVPTGSKGGFVAKRILPSMPRDVKQEKGVAAYKAYINALLNITDNREKNAVEHPEGVVCLDGQDPYLAVAADKGTASFSDIANGISQEHGFWLGDAFASGGSAGYDHKKMGITAKGAWEAVKRHFKEMGKNIQAEDFDVVGVGDMGGDVFGNGMLLSKKIRLVGAFNHLHIFCDPDPNTDTSFKERKRLFDNVLGWDQYNESYLSKGGRIYSRHDKALKLTKEIQARFGIEESTVSPDILIKAMLKAETDLLWFGGIGTYIKSEDESHADVSDKANDNLRINAEEVGAKVIGEGANLGVTQNGRIAYGMTGGRINTDFIDNSAGVNCSDQEVNIKILMQSVFKPSQKKSRDNLLEKMEDSVSEAVLRNNYQQTQSLSFMDYVISNRDIDTYLRIISDIENRFDIGRHVEFLPDKETLENRKNKDKTLTRPELSTILCYTKNIMFEELMDSNIFKREGIEQWVVEYFPKDVQKKYIKNIKAHSLKNEIIATQVTNSVVNRLGPASIYQIMNTTGKGFAEIVNAYLSVRDVFDMYEVWQSIENLDYKVVSKRQMYCFRKVHELLEYGIYWTLSVTKDGVLEEKRIASLRSCYKTLMEKLESVLSDEGFGVLERRANKLAEDNVPKTMVDKIARLSFMASVFHINDVAEKTKSNALDVANVYNKVSSELKLAALKKRTEITPKANVWEEQAFSNLLDQIDVIHYKAVEEIVKKYGAGKKDWWGKWVNDNEILLDLYQNTAKEILASDTFSVSMLSAVKAQLTQLFS